MYQPLADLLRPQTLDEVYGQEHILGKGAVLRRLIDSGNIPNMVFYGPSGTGKTTVANIIAKQTNRTLYKLNATTASTADIKEIVAQLDTFMAPNGVLLYLDEIQSFNKKQQQSLLEHIENGKITLIASTTENPYFYVFNAILSRSTVFEFKQISAEATLKAVRRAVETTEHYRNGQERLKVIELVLWKKTHNLQGAALQIPCHVDTAKVWHGDFIRLVASYYGLMDE